MKLINYKSIKIGYVALIAMLFLSLSSCIVYRDTSSGYGSYDEDGIYAYDNKPVANEVAVEETRPSYNMYQDYFKRQAEVYDTISEDDIFTDVDSLGYGDDQYYEDEQYTEGNPPWEYTDNVTINFNTGWYRPYYYNSWYNSWYYPYNSWYGYGYYDSFYYPYYNRYPYYGYYGGYYPFYGYNYYRPWYYGYNRYYNNYNYGRRYTYNTSRLAN